MSCTSSIPPSRPPACACSLTPSLQLLRKKEAVEWGETSVISLLSLNNLKLWLIREWWLIFCLSVHSWVYLWITERLRIAAKEMKSHLAESNTLWPEERGYSESYLILWLLSCLGSISSLQKWKTAEVIWRRTKTLIFQMWWPKVQAFLFGLMSTLLVRRLKMPGFLIFLSRIRDSFSSSVCWWLKSMFLGILTSPDIQGYVIIKSGDWIVCVL